MDQLKIQSWTAGKGDRLTAKRTGIPAEHVLTYAVGVEHMATRWYG